MASMSLKSGKAAKTHDYMPLKTLKFKKPSNADMEGTGMLESGASNTYANQSKLNGSVGDSLNAFIASRSNSAVKRGPSSQNLSNDGEQPPIEKPHVFKRDKSDDRVQKYLRRNASQQEAERAERQRSGEHEPKPPRSAKSQATSKQVRFDIKEGLRDMIRDTQFDITQVRNRTIEKRMTKEGKRKEQAGREALQVVARGSEPPRSSTSQLNIGAAKPPPGATKSPAFQARASERRAPRGDGNSGAMSPASSRKQSLKLALMYKKEALETKHRRGEIDIPRPGSQRLDTHESEAASPRAARVDEDNFPGTPQTNSMPPPMPMERPEPASTLEQKSENTHRRPTSLSSQRNRSASNVKQERKVGTIFRMRSESPIGVRPARTVDGGSGAHSRRQTADVEDPHEAALEGEKENQSMNRSFFAGQIIKMQSKSHRAPQTCRQPYANTATFTVQKEVDPAQSHLYVDTAPTKSPPSFAAGSAPSGEIQYRDEYIRTSTATGNVHSPRTDPRKESHRPSPPQINIEGEAFEEPLPTESTQPDLHEPAAEEFSTDLFDCIWDSFKVSEAEFLSCAEQYSRVIEAAKQALHEPLKHEAALPTHRETHRLREMLAPEDRLRLIRRNLRSALMDSFLPLIHEIIQLRDRLAYRKDSYKYAIRQPLKASIISDICSRLRQKIVLKVLFLQSQFKKNINSLFAAYFDLLVRKRVYMVTFDVLSNFKQRQLEKQTYLGYAQGQLQELRKLQAFDCWKRLKAAQALHREKQRQAGKLLTTSKLLKVVTAWKVRMVERRERQIGLEMAARYFLMKKRHQLFVKWVSAHKLTHKIKTKAIRMVSHQHEHAYLGDTCTDSQLSSHRSTTSFDSQANAEAWLRDVKERSEELFYSEIQELVLEREHCRTYRRSLRAKVTPEALRKRLPLEFDRAQNAEAWKQVPSQALISNREQIYIMYPELQTQAAPVPSRSGQLPRQTSGERSHSSTRLGPLSSEAQRVQQPAILPQDLATALQPQLQRIMQPQPSTEALQSQEQMLGVKYSVHQALVQQQNMFPDSLNATIERSQSAERPKPPRQDVGSPRRIVAPFKPNQQPKLRAKDGARAPNQLFQKLQKQLEQQFNLESGCQTAAGADNPGAAAAVQLPVEVQLQAHIRSMLQMLKDGRREGTHSHESSTIHRAKSLHFALQQGDAEPLDQRQGASMSLTDYIQVALQSRISLLQLNEFRLQYQYLAVWRQALVNKLLLKDLATFQSYQRGRQALRAWHLHIQRQKLKALNHWKTKQMQAFYALFSKWAKGNRQLMYEEEKMVRQFKARRALAGWRKYADLACHCKRAERRAIQFYCYSLHTKALVGLYQNSFKLALVKKFKRRQAFLKFFKRTWAPRTRQRQLLRRVLARYALKEESQERGRYQRQFDLLKGALEKWKKRVSQKQKLIHTYMALNHYKNSLLFRTFYRLKGVPMRRRGLDVLANLVKASALKPAFNQLRYVCTTFQDQQVQEWRRQRGIYVCQRVIAVWHANAVKQKIAKMFFQRKYLNALQEHVLQNNYVRPLSLHEHHLKVKAFSAFKRMKNLRWQEDRAQLILRALEQKRANQLLRGCYLAFMDNILQQKKKRIIMGTVMDFRKHTLAEKTFRYWKIYLMKQKKQNLMNQVAKEFYEEKIQRLIEKGRTQVRLNTQSGVLLNANQDLMLRVITEWKFATRWLKRTKYRLDQIVQSKKQLTTLKCFLAWRAIARYEQSDFTCSIQRQQAQNKPGSDLDMLHSYEMTPSLANTYSIQEEYYGAGSAKDARMQKVNDIMVRYSNFQSELSQSQEGQPPLSQPQSEIHQIHRQSDQMTSFVNTDQASPLFQQQVEPHIGSYEQTESRVTSREPARGDSKDAGLTNDYSDSTLNQRAERNSRSRSRSSSRNYGLNHGKSDMVATTTEEEARVSQMSHVTPGMYQDTSELADDLQDRSKSRQHSSIQSFQPEQRPSRKPDAEDLPLNLDCISTDFVKHGDQPKANDYATFNANQYKSIQNDYIADDTLSSAGRLGTAQRHNQSMGHHKQSIQNGSITLTNNTNLYDELESIFNHNKEWIDEQNQREQLLKRMADHYETSLTQGNNETLPQPAQDESYVEYQAPLQEIDEEADQVNPMDSQIN